MCTTMERTRQNTIFSWNITLFWVSCIVVSLAFGEKLDELPHAVQDTIKHELGNIPIDEIDLDEDDGEIEYEIDAEVDDKELDLKIAEDGTLLEREEELDFHELPEPVKRTIKYTLGENFEIDETTKKMRRGKTFYDIDVEIDDREIELYIAVNGKLLKREVEDDDDTDEYELSPFWVLDMAYIPQPLVFKKMVQSPVKKY